MDQPPLEENLPAPKGAGYKLIRTLTPDEQMQRLIVIVLMVMLVGIVIVICIQAIASPTADLRSLSSVVLLPIISVAGPVIGFYFGRRPPPPIPTAPPSPSPSSGDGEP